MEKLALATGNRSWEEMHLHRETTDSELARFQRPGCQWRQDATQEIEKPSRDGPMSIFSCTRVTTEL